MCGGGTFLSSPLLSHDAIGYGRAIMSAQHRISFTLTGPSVEFDSRVHAVRGDLADIALADRWFAPHYAEPMAMICVAQFAPLLEKPNGEQVSELLAGETFYLLDTSGDWSWGYTAHDHYVGYLLAESLGPIGLPLPHTQPRNLSALDAAHAYLGQPYVWGGRGGEGIDCSGLVQQSLAAAGVLAPRDSDQQLAILGKDIAEDAPLQRGDIIFFPGHVGMMDDERNLLHATRHHGKVVIEPLADVELRFKQRNDGIGIVARRRIGA